jgi:hypothetical protein
MFRFIRKTEEIALTCGYRPKELLLDDAVNSKRRKNDENRKIFKYSFKNYVYTIVNS